MKLKASIYVIIAVVGVALGLRLPDAVFSLMDGKDFVKPQTYPMEAVELGVEYLLSDYLRLAGSYFKRFDMGTGITSDRDADMIYRSARETLILLEEYLAKAGLDEVFPEARPAIMNLAGKLPEGGVPEEMSAADIFIKISPIIGVSDLQPVQFVPEPSDDFSGQTSETGRKMMTAILWECIFQDGDHGIRMIFDDQSGQMLSLICHWKCSSFAQGAGMDMNEAALRMGLAYSYFAQDVYGFEKPGIAPVGISGGPEDESFDAAAQTEALELGRDGNSGDFDTYGNPTVETTWSNSMPDYDDTGGETSVKILGRNSAAVYAVFPEASGMTLTIPICVGDDFYSLNHPYLSENGGLIDNDGQ